MKIKTVSFEEAGKQIRFVRDTVFGDEQKVARDLDWDEWDPKCIHVLATEDSGNPIGTGRMQPNGKIGRLAVLRDWRGNGVGRRMVEALLDTATDLPIRSVYLHAQVHAIPFYEKLGFQRSGDEFSEGNIPHVKMIRECGSPPGGRFFKYPPAS